MTAPLAKQDVHQPVEPTQGRREDALRTTAPTVLGTGDRVVVRSLGAEARLVTLLGAGKVQVEILSNQGLPRRMMVSISDLDLPLGTSLSLPKQEFVDGADRLTVKGQKLQINTGQCIVVHGEAPNAPERVWTEGVGDCVVLAIRGRNSRGGIDTLFAHLHSKQYLVPALGGSMNRDDAVIRQVRDFTRTHSQLRTMATTNFDHRLNIRANINTRFSIDLDEIKQLGAGGNDGVVTLDATKFQLYAARPSGACDGNSISHLEALVEPGEAAKAEAPPWWQAILTIIRGSR